MLTYKYYEYTEGGDTRQSRSTVSRSNIRSDKNPTAFPVETKNESARTLSNIDSYLRVSHISLSSFREAWKYSLYVKINPAIWEDRQNEIAQGLP